MIGGTVSGRGAAERRTRPSRKRRAPPLPPACPERLYARRRRRPPGPRSRTWSAVLMTSRWCSITTTVLPCPTRRWSTSSRPPRVLQMQPRRRLVQDVERPAGVLRRGQLLGQLHPLRLAAAQRRGRLPQRQVAEADVLQRTQLRGDGRHVLQQRNGLLHGQRQHVGDGDAAVGTAPPGSPGCSGVPCTARTSRRRPAESASRWRFTPSP